MQQNDIDRVIERYVTERKQVPQQVAQQHFLVYASLVCRHDEFNQFMRRTRGLLVYYIDSLSLFDNPFRNARVCWLLLLFAIFAFSTYMLTMDELRLAGLVLDSGAIIFGTSLWKTVWSRWLDTDLLIACYREIIELIDSIQVGQDGAAA